MKKGLSVLLAGMLIVLTCTACGSDEVKTIEREAAETEASTQDTNDENVTEASDDAAADTAEAADDRYIFTATENGKSIDITADMPMSEILPVIGTGDESRYYEAASCAFEGLDKMYFYEHFEIDTYPNGDEDFVSCIFLSDDMAMTKEGVYIGMSYDDMENAYGSEFVQDGTKYSYEKGGMVLEFVVENELIRSIAYRTTILDNQ